MDCCLNSNIQRPSLLFAQTKHMTKHMPETSKDDSLPMQIRTAHSVSLHALMNKMYGRGMRSYVLQGNLQFTLKIGKASSSALPR